MGLFNKRKLPHEVFTPRKPEVNSDMYISRPRLEKDLKRELLGTKHVIIHGESGCGKSWLYKKVLSDMNINYEVINLANAARYGSITEEIKMVHSSLQPTRKTGYSEKKAGELSAGIAKGQLEFVGEFSVSEQDPVELLFKHLYKKSKKQVSVLVFDNLETIFHSEKLMDELGNLIVLLDDRRYAQYNVKFVIVGVPSGIIEYFSKTKNLTTISNRLSEISEVTRLNADQVTSFIKSGFIEELMINFESSSLYKKYEDHIAWVTNGIPQRLHEYCLEVCYFCEENNWSAKDQYLNLADQKWVAKSLSKNYVVIDNIMNSKETTVGTEILQTSTARSQSTSASSSPES